MNINISRYFFKIFIFFVFISTTFYVYSQDKSNTYQETSAVIESIDKKSNYSKNKKIFAVVSFKTVENKQITTMVELSRIPFIGTFSKPGDIIEISYDKNDPGIAYSRIGNIVNQYGWYILIGIGIISSILIIVRRKKQGI
jgi:hypothetical protein